jgi:hypothetical protein
MNQPGASPMTVHGQRLFYRQIEFVTHIMTKNHGSVAGFLVGVLLLP